jgi:hypothetical protein
MNQRYQNSLINDSNLSITVSLTNILIKDNPVDTPWTDASLSVPGFPTYKNKATLGCASSVSTFATSMSNLNLTFEFDHAVAIVKYETLSV